MAYEMKNISFQRAFTLIELLVVIAVIGILAGLTLTSVSRTKRTAMGAQCRNNLKQMQMAWIMYAGDNREELPPAGHGADQSNTPSFRNSKHWCLGNMKLPEERTNADWIQKGLLWYYTKMTKIYKCPADRTMNLRSITMNGFLNPEHPELAPPETFLAGRIMHKATDINPPSGIWVLIDERPTSINTPLFEVWMDQAKGANALIREHPSNEHPGAGIGFADGHVELKQWRTSQMQSGFPYIPAPFNEDLAWLADRTTTPIKFF